MVSTTAKYWGIRSVWSNDEPVFEFECFVASDGKVIPVPGGDYGYTGYAMMVGRDVFATKLDAQVEAIKRAQKDVDTYRDSLKRVEARLVRLRKEMA